MRLSFFLKLLLIVLLVRNSQQGWFKSVVKSIAKSVKKVVQKIKNLTYSFLDPNNEHISGECEIGGRKWDCTVTAGNDWGLKLSGSTMNVSEEFRFANGILIPYCHITGVTSSSYTGLVGLLRFTNRTYTVSINRLGATSTLIIKQNHPDPVNKFINNINAYKGTILSVLRTARDVIQTNEESYKVEQHYINANNAAYNADKDTMNDLNSEISSIVTSLGIIGKERDNLIITNTARNSVLATKMSELDKNSKKKDNCLSESVSIAKLIRTYKKYEDEFTEEKVFEILNFEFSNLCKFQIAAEDVILILPSQRLEINRVRKQVARERNYEALNALFDLDEFFILHDLSA